MFAHYSGRTSRDFPPLLRVNALPRWRKVQNGGKVEEESSEWAQRNFISHRLAEAPTYGQSEGKVVLGTFKIFAAEEQAKGTTLGFRPM